MVKRYIVDLTEEERANLRALTRRGKTAARTMKRSIRSAGALGSMNIPTSWSRKRVSPSRCDRVAVTERRTKVDFAHQLRALVDEHFPTAEVIRVVADNLNTHGVSALDEAFPPAEARRIAKKLESHPTPKHGSWLNAAAVELAVLTQQCLDRRLGDLASVRREVAEWEEQRNVQQVQVHWRFGATDARTKLSRLYPLNSP